MGAYDIATKVILTHCRKAALEFFLGLSVGHCDILELPQETTTLRKADFPMRVLTREGEECIVLLEVESRWESNVPLRLLEYEARYRLQTGLPVLPAVMLLTESKGAVSHYEAGGIRYQFTLIPLAEMEAREIMERGDACLIPFVPLMKGGRDLFDEAEALLGPSLGAHRSRSTQETP